MIDGPSTWRQMLDAPRDESFVILKTPWTESGVTVAFYSHHDDGEWWESEASSNPVTAFGQPEGWASLPRDAK